MNGLITTTGLTIVAFFVFVIGMMSGATGLAGLIFFAWTPLCWLTGAAWQRAASKGYVRSPFVVDRQPVQPQYRTPGAKKSRSAEFE